MKCTLANLFLNVADAEELGSVLRRGAYLLVCDITLCPETDPN